MLLSTPSNDLLTAPEERVCRRVISHMASRQRRCRQRAGERVELGPRASQERRRAPLDGSHFPSLLSMNFTNRRESPTPQSLLELLCKCFWFQRRPSFCSCVFSKVSLVCSGRPGCPPWFSARTLCPCYCAPRCNWGELKLPRGHTRFEDHSGRKKISYFNRFSFHD